MPYQRYRPDGTPILEDFRPFNVPRPPGMMTGPIGWPQAVGGVRGGGRLRSPGVQQPTGEAWHQEEMPDAPQDLPDFRQRAPRDPVAHTDGQVHEIQQNADAHFGPTPDLASRNFRREAHRSGSRRDHNVHQWIPRRTPYEWRHSRRWH